jgi:hypothetical protein
MDVMDVIEGVCRRVPPSCAYTLLEIFKVQWYSYPRKRYDFESWYPVIRNLTENLASSRRETLRWRKKYPRLLVADQVQRSDLPMYNRRRQALAWFRRQSHDYHLVQGSFTELGYPRLEEVCEKEGGFSQLREPRGAEIQFIRVLEELTSTILNGFFGEGPLPPCKVIVSDDASWGGLANCVRLSKPRETAYGFKVHYELPYVALKKRILARGRFHEALATYLHELSHCFGGDQSARFSAALTSILQITLECRRAIDHAAAGWNEVDRRSRKPENQKTSGI